MKETHLIDIVRVLNAASISYVIVGGIAVNVHGYVRHTKDVDLVVALDEQNCIAAMKALGSLGYVPRIPEPAERFADPAARKRWIEEKGMIVFQLWNDSRPETPIDVFVSEPFDVREELRICRFEEFEPNLRAPIASLACLRALKLAAGRPQDLLDLSKLDDLQAGASAR